MTLQAQSIVIHAGFLHPRYPRRLAPGRRKILTAQARGCNRVTMKNVFFKCAGFGAGFAVAIIAGIGLFAYVSSLPHPEKQWNTEAVKASFTEMTLATGGSNVSLDFSFTLQNTTDQDYILPNDKENLFVALPDGKGLYHYHNSTDPYLENVVIDQSPIPSKQRIIVTIHLIYAYNEWFPKEDRGNKDKLGAYWDARLSRIDGLTFFDKGNRYQINFPNGWKTAKERSGGEGHG